VARNRIKGKIITRNLKREKLKRRREDQNLKRIIQKEKERKINKKSDKNLGKRIWQEKNGRKLIRNPKVQRN